MKQFRRELLVDGENFTIMRVFLKEGEGEKVFHIHAYEQAFYLIEGEIEFITEQENKVYNEGDVCYVPPNVKHRGIALKNSVIVNVYGKNP